SRQQSCAVSLDHLVGARQQCDRNLDAERLRGLEVDDKLELVGLLHRKIGWLFALEDTVDVASSMPVEIDIIDTVRRQSAIARVIAQRIDSRKAVLRCEREDQLAICSGDRAREYDQAATRRPCKVLDGTGHLR